MPGPAIWMFYFAICKVSVTIGGVVTHNWKAFWLSSSLGAAVIMLLVAIFFRNNNKIQNKPAA